MRFTELHFSFKQLLVFRTVLRFIMLKQIYAVTDYAFCSLNLPSPALSFIPSLSFFFVVPLSRVKTNCDLIGPEKNERAPRNRGGAGAILMTIIYFDTLFNSLRGSVDRAKISHPALLRSVDGGIGKRLTGR